MPYNYQPLNFLFTLSLLSTFTYVTLGVAVNNMDSVVGEDIDILPQALANNGQQLQDKEVLEKLGDMNKFILYQKQVESMIYENLSQISYCIGDDKDTIKQLIQDSFRPQDYDYDVSDPICNRFDNVIPYLCQKDEIMNYIWYNLPSNGDPEKVPDNDKCKAGSLKSSCEPGFFNSINPKIGGDGDKPQRCCPGFFCPRMLTCMIPCPQGAYCPYAKPKPPPADFLQDDSNWCAPYAYKVRQPLGCGGADRWTIFPQDAFPRPYSWWWYGTGSIYCNWGWFCPSPTQAFVCQPGHYCKPGSDHMISCSPLVDCPYNTIVPERDYVGFTFVFGLFSFLFFCWLLARGYRWITSGVMPGERVVIKWNGPRRAFQANVVQLPDREEVSEQLLGVTGQQRETDSAREDEEEYPVPTHHGSVELADLPRTVAHHHRHRSIQHRRSHSSTVGQDKVYVQVDGKYDSGNIGQSQPDQDRPDSPFLTPALSHEIRLHSSRGHSRQNSINQELGPLSKYHQPTPSTLELALEEVASDEQGQGQGQDGSIVPLEMEEMSPFILQSPMTQHTSGEQFRNNRFRLNLKFIGLGYRLQMGKVVLQSVSGKLRSERITAILGPSGAGKTTLMTILAGKQSSGGQQFGVIILNNQPIDSLARYRRIMGFVPQDDIMYSDLSVQETLLFSARYRLPVDCNKEMRWQYVENAMEVLNLMDIRHQVIGNEENRGISGGQRKRVNVAIELVSNPSLLFLDEPTSGLDSTSSKVLVEALKSTAEQGVTICAVVHQPSYQTFGMFDDVLFLGTGGRTVYYGPMVEVQRYFDGLNFKIPDHMNPADAYMDIISGVIYRQDHPDYKVEDLYKLWQEHAGLDVGVVEQVGVQSVDLDVEEHVLSRLDRQLKQFEVLGGEQGILLQAKEILIVNLYWLVSSFMEIWKSGVTFSARVRHWWNPSQATENYLPLRHTPGIWPQFIWCFQRVVQRKLRHKFVFTLELVVFSLTGCILGYISDRGKGTIYKFGERITYTIVALALLTTVSSLRTFGNDRLVFFRESGSGLNKIAFFVAMDTMDHVNTILRSVCYLMVYQSFAEFRAVIWQMMIITIGVVYACTGAAYVLCQMMDPGPAQLTAAVFALTNALIAPRTDLKTGILHMLHELSFAKYALEGYVIAEANRLRGVWLLARCFELRLLHYDVRHYWKCVLLLFVLGVVFRFVACVGLFVLNKAKQK